MAIYKFLLVKKCIRLVLSRFSEEFALLLLFICENSTLIYFITSVEFGLVIIGNVSSESKTNLDFCCYF